MADLSLEKGNASFFQREQSFYVFSPEKHRKTKTTLPDVRWRDIFVLSNADCAAYVTKVAKHLFPHKSVD
jgi:hypothetical protein